MRKAHVMLVKSINVGGRKTYLQHFQFCHLIFKMIYLPFGSISQKGLSLKYFFQNDYFLSRNKGLGNDNSLVSIT